MSHFDQVRCPNCNGLRVPMQSIVPIDIKYLEEGEEITFRCPKCGKVVKSIKEVI